MNTLTTTQQPVDTAFYVIHPLDDALEQKCSTEGLGPMALTPTVRYSLLTLRVYLIAMTLIVIYRTLVLAGLTPHFAR